MPNSLFLNITGAIAPVAPVLNTPLLSDMKHDLNLTLKMYKVVFSDKQITEIKKKMHIDPIFTYSDSEIALKVCRNKQRFKFNRRPLCQVFHHLESGFWHSSQLLTSTNNFHRKKLLEIQCEVNVFFPDWCNIYHF